MSSTRHVTSRVVMGQVDFELKRAN